MTQTPSQTELIPEEVPAVIEPEPVEVPAVPEAPPDSILAELDASAADHKVNEFALASGEIQYDGGAGGLGLAGDVPFCGPVDKDGLAFDPRIHQTNVDGTPKLDPAGRLKQRSGRNPAKEQALKVPLEYRAKPEVVKAAVERNLFREGAEQTVDEVLLVCGIVFGQAWLTASDEERAAMVNAMEKVYRKYDYKDKPLWLEVSIAFGMYAVPRLYHPDTKSRFQKIKEWIIVHWLRWFPRRMKETSTS